MKKFISRLSVFFLAAGFLLSMGACNSAPETAPSSGTAAVSSENTDPFGKYSPPITLTSVKYTMADWTYPEGDDINNNNYTRDFSQELGINVKYLWTTSSDEYGSKLNVTIASGELPDFFVVPDSSTFQSLVNSGQVADLTEIYDTFASPSLKKCSDAFQEGFDSAKVDGKLMALPRLEFGTIDLPNILWMRSDWLEKCSLSAPKSISDLENIAKTFMTKIDGCTYGIALDQDLENYMVATTLGIANAYHAYPGIWVNDSSGKLAYGSVQPEMKNVLSTLQRWYQGGILFKEFAAEDMNKVNEDMINGKVGIEFGANWNSYMPFTDAVKKDKTAIWKPYEVPSADGTEVKLQGNWPVTEYFVVNKSCKNPEAVIKMANEFRKITEEVKWTDDVLNWQNSPVYYTDPNQDYQMHVNLSKAVTEKDPANLTPVEKQMYDKMMLWADKKDPDGYGYYFQRSGEGAHALLKKYVDDGNILLNSMEGSMPPNYAKVSSTLNKLELTAFTKIIMGSPISDFDTFVSNWKKAGGDAATAEVNSIYGK